MKDHTPAAMTRAKRLRKDMSLPEVLLWRLLRQRPGGVKFRRQHPIGNFIADFYCAEKKLVVEIDGTSHDTGDKPERDQKRDIWLRSRAIEVIRIPAADVLRDAAAVTDSLVALCVDAPPPSALRAATSPGGGGFLESPV